MDAQRHALVVGNVAYDHEDFGDLEAVGADLQYMEHVLLRRDIGMFDSCTVVGETTSAELARAIETFLGERQLGETALVYFSGHGQYSVDEQELFFIAKDSDPADLVHTAVRAGFLNGQMQECRATSKVLLLDCCDSGSIFSAFTTKGAGTHAPSSTPRPSGVYVITASDALQSASAKAPPGSALGTSWFTGEIVEGLLSGRVKAGPDPWITTDDLFRFLVKQMQQAERLDSQRPTRSMLRVTGDLVIARSTAQAVKLSRPGSDQAARRRVPDKALHMVDSDRGGGPRWAQLINYYRSCLAADAAAETMPERARSTDYRLLDSGPEKLQSGLAATIPLPEGWNDARLADREIWYGYPAVTLVEPGSNPGSGKARAGPRIAPLVMQQLEIGRDEHAGTVLVPTGAVIPHRGIIDELRVDQDDAEMLLAEWQPSWQHGNANQMLQAIRELLRDLELPELEPLDPSALRGESARDERRGGAHNAAMLLCVKPGASLGIVENLAYLAEHLDLIPGTALETLGRGWASAGRASAEPDKTLADEDQLLVVTPDELNESQELVLRSAMSRPLTIATGPPGTGKTQLVVNVVATAVCAKQSVLVASTNNRAVNEVSKRCTKHATGLLIRTGNKEEREKERAFHQSLLVGTEPQRDSVPTTAGELSNERRKISAWRKDLAVQADREARLWEALEARTAAAESLALPTELLTLAWQNGTGDLAQWADRARGASDITWFAARRRRKIGERYARAVMEAGGDPDPLRRRLTGDAKALDTLVSFADAECVLRDDLKETDAPSDDDLRQRGQTLTARSQELSRKLVQSFVAGRVARAHPQIEARATALATGKDPQRTQRELMEELPGWAITTHSILQLRREPQMFDLVVVDEASQCSIPAVLPLLFRAKRALIIGDTKQLGHIAPIPKHHERLARARAGLSASWLEERQLSYVAHSAYHAGSQVSGRPLLLDEHYRCHPDIVGVVNDYCYNGRLEVLTDVRALHRVPASTTPERWVLAWDDVDGTPRPGDNGRSWFNDAEIERVCDIVRRLLADLSPEANIGVVTPFRAQKERLETALHAERRSDATRERVQIGTVHQFQGGARDAMVLSLVANDRAPEPTRDWVASQLLNLWNVAITRARAHLITVGAQSFWSQQPGLPAQLAKKSPRLPPAAWPTAVAPLDGVAAGDRLMDQLHDQLIQAGHGDLERNALLDGYRCDFVFGGPDAPAAVVLDRGARNGHDAARHMYLTLTRCRLLADVAGDACSNGTVARGIRVPAWRVLAGAGIPRDGG